MTPATIRTSSRTTLSQDIASGLAMAAFIAAVAYALAGLA